MNKRERIYVSLASPERITSPPELIWIRPPAVGMADWANAGDGPYTFLSLHKTTGLLYHNSLKDELYTAEYQGFLVDVPPKYFGGDSEGWAVAAKKARLIRKVDSWGPITAAIFACDCAERALDAIQDRDTEQGFKRGVFTEERETLALVRQMAETAKENETRVRSGPASKYGLLGLLWFLEDEADEAEKSMKEIGAKLEVLSEGRTRVGASMYATKAVREICYLSLGRMATKVAKGARDAMSALYYFRGPVKYRISELKNNPELREQMNAGGKQEWEAELAWQANQLAEVIGEEEWWTDDF